MPTPTDYILGGFASMEAKKEKEAQRSRRVHPEIEAMIRQYGPKGAAIRMRLGNQGGQPQSTQTQPSAPPAPQGPMPAVFQGMAPGSEGGLSSTAMALASQEPSGFAEGPALGRAEILQGTAHPAQGLGEMEAPLAEAPSLGEDRPFTAQDLGDYAAIAPTLRAARPDTRETPEERAAREQANIEARGNQSRQSEGVKQTGRKELKGEDAIIARERIAAANARAQASLEGAWDRTVATLSALERERNNRTMKTIAASRIRDAQRDVDNLRNNISRMRSSMGEMANDPELMKTVQDMEGRLQKSESFVEQLWDEHDQSGVEVKESKSKSSKKPAEAAQGVIKKYSASQNKTYVFENGRRVGVEDGDTRRR